MLRRTVSKYSGHYVIIHFVGRDIPADIYFQFVNASLCITRNCRRVK